MLFRDRLMRESFDLALPPGRDYSRSEMMDETRKLLRRAQVFEVSNVADYFYVDSPQEEWDWFHDFPRPMPPFRLTWFEWRFPKVSNNRGKMVSLSDHPWRRLGYLVAVDDAGEGVPQGIRWAVNMLPYGESVTGRILVCPILMFGITHEFQAVGTDGSKNKKANLSFAFPGIDLRKLNERQVEIAREIGQGMIGYGYPAMLALSLLNCRNVVVRKVQAPIALVKKHQKNGHEISTLHSVIEIQPIVELTKRVTNYAGYSRSAAAIVRGHFKDYTHGKGLFGKYREVFWWDQRISTGGTAQYQLAKESSELDHRWARNLMGALPQESGTKS